MRAFPVALCATILSTSVLAGATGPQITEAHYLEPFQGDHPALAPFVRALAEAEAAARGARTLANPELGASREAPGEIEQLDVSVAWQPPHPARRRLAITAVDAGVAAARSRLEAERLALRQTARAAFARWATATATVETLERWARTLDQLSARERERAASGEASGLDARRLALAASEARGRHARAAAERLEALAAIRALRGDLPSDARPASPPLPVAQSAVENHPLLLALRTELEAATAERALAEKVLDMPTLSAGWQRQEAAGATAEGATLGLRWSIPLFDRGQAERSGARARAEEAAAKLSLAEREIAARREGALVAYQALRAAASDARSTTDDGAAVMAAATAAFQAGETSVTDLLDALRAATEAELAALELHAEALAAHRRLEEASGPAATAP